jgi:hypothetical protein
VIYNGTSAVMSPDDIARRCDAVNGNPGNSLGGIRRTVPTGASSSPCASRARPVCPASHRKPPPAIARAIATLTAGGRTYAVGGVAAWRIRLTVRPAITTGKYMLDIRESRGRSRRKVTYLAATIPITIR